ncbi:MAG: hypothetical protein EKK34_28450, partial [Mycobacterium sp.]
HYNRHRYYQPGTGRYCTADPLGLAAAPNPYGYPRNPTVETDPLGLMPCPSHPEELPRAGHISPLQIRYSQNSISTKFRNGGSVEEFSDLVRDGKLNPNNVPPIRIVEFDGELYSLDNRRPWAYRRPNVPEIP